MSILKLFRELSIDIIYRISWICLIVSIPVAGTAGVTLSMLAMVGFLVSISLILRKNKGINK